MASLQEWFDSKENFSGENDLKAVEPVLEALHESASKYRAAFGEAVAEILIKISGNTILFRPGQTSLKSIESMREKAARYAKSGDRRFAHIFNDTLAATIYVPGGVARLQEIHRELNGSATDIPLEDTGFTIKPRGVGKGVVDACYITLEWPGGLAEVQIWCPNSHLSMKVFHELAKVPKAQRPAAWTRYKNCFQLAGWCRDEQVPLQTAINDLRPLLPEALHAELRTISERLSKDQRKLSVFALGQSCVTEELETLFSSFPVFAVKGQIHNPVPLDQLLVIVIKQ